MIARPSIVLLLAVGVVHAQVKEDEFCKRFVDQHCNEKDLKTAKQPCTPVYGAATKGQNPELLHQYIKEHIGNSFEYLLQWANFNNYKKDREGFAKLYRKLSDDTWDDSIKLVKYLGKRGVVFNFEDLVNKPVYDANTDKEKFGAKPYDTKSETEVGSLAKVLDLHKHLAMSGNLLHANVLKRDNPHSVGASNEHHDIELAHFIEEEFAGKHAQTVRDLAGHSSDLYRLLSEGHKQEKSSSSENPSNLRGLYVHLFDEYLRKLY